MRFVGERGWLDIAREKMSASDNTLLREMQAANKPVQLALSNLRVFVKNNPTVDAVSLITAVKDAVDDFQAIANQNGVTK